VWGQVVKLIKWFKFQYYNRLFLFWESQAIKHDNNLFKENGQSSEDDFNYSMRKAFGYLEKLVENM
jgi:hypothetical protein